MNPLESILPKTFESVHVREHKPSVKQPLEQGDPTLPTGLKPCTLTLVHTHTQKKITFSYWEIFWEHGQARATARREGRESTLPLDDDGLIPGKN